jgi:alpha-N-arabinofuranosidase
MRDAVVAAHTLNVFNDRCDSVVMANVAQLVNNLHSLYLAAGDKLIETPNYHVFDLYKGHMGARQLQVVNGCGQLEREGFAAMPRVSASASEAQDGSITITMANMEYDQDIELELAGVDGSIEGRAEVALLRGDVPQAHNTFENPLRVKPAHSFMALKQGGRVELPAASVMSLRIVR